MKTAKLKYLLGAYVIGILYFLLFRLVNTWVFCGGHPDVTMDGLYGHALLVGLWFDTAVSCYMLALPLLLLIVGELARIKSKGYYAVAHHVIVTLYIVGFFACAADIPYFNYFFTRLNAVALNYEDDLGVVVDMIVKEPSYIGFFFVFLAVAASYWFLMRWLYRRCREGFAQHLPLWWSVPGAVVLLAVCFLGMRGSCNFKQRPLRVGYAYFCNNAFLNQIGLNPVFTLMKSVEELGTTMNRPVELMDCDEAQRIYESELCESSELLLVNEDLDFEGYNVVMVIMESMTEEKTGMTDPSQSLTPCLDTLMSKSLLFDSLYAAGIHTYNGIFSTLFGHPAILEQHTMKKTTIPLMCGAPQAFQNGGYETYFFFTHNPEFDNMLGFLRANSYKNVFSQVDYPKEAVVGTWGVPDHVMMDKAIEELGKYRGDKPFFATLLTCSDHTPYAYPEGIDLQPKHDDLDHKIVEYADWAIGRFMRKAAQQPWFEKTLFVFVADHGASGRNMRYDMPLSYHHIPLLFYAPGKIVPERCHRLALQLDVTPTLMGMVGLPYNNNTFGIDLRHYRRKYAFFSADDKIGVLDGEWFYVYRVHEAHESMYRYADGDPADYIESQRERAKLMQRYAFAMIQHSQTMLVEQKTMCDF